MSEAALPPTVVSSSSLALVSPDRCAVLRLLPFAVRCSQPKARSTVFVHSAPSERFNFQLFLLHLNLLRSAYVPGRIRARSPMATSTAAANERRPLLNGSRSPPPPSSSRDSDDSDDESPDPEPVSSKRKLLRFVLLWSAVSALTLYLIVEAFRRGGGEFDWKGALKKAGGGGLAGAMAMIIQVLALMPLRTVMKCVSTPAPSPRRGWKLTNLFFRSPKATSIDSERRRQRLAGSCTRREDGRGTMRDWLLRSSKVQSVRLPVLHKSPTRSLSSQRHLTARFGDTASNAGILALLSSNPFLSRLPSPLKTAFASLVGALFRMVLMPVDTLKTTMQAQGSSNALRILKERVKTYGPGTLWAGAWATAAANFVGSWPWFATYNALSTYLPPAPPSDGSWGPVWAKLGRQAFIGFASSVVSDTCSNSLRVIKTYRQVSRKKVGYRALALLFALFTSTGEGLTPCSVRRESGSADHASGGRAWTVWARPQDAHPRERLAGPSLLGPLEGLCGAHRREGQEGRRSVDGCRVV